MITRLNEGLASTFRSEKALYSIINKINEIIYVVNGLKVVSKSASKARKVSKKSKVSQSREEG